jgi:predicted metal-dependent peptidase
MTDTTDLDYIKKKVDRAKFEIMFKESTTFFSALLSNLKLIYTDDPNINTAGTDGINLYLNTKFVKELSLEELVGLLVHEVMHVAYEHMLRCKEQDLDHHIYNVAGDYAINYFIINKGFKLPECRLYDEKFAGWGTRQIYDYLIENNVQVELPWDDLIPSEESSESYEEVISNITKAALSAKMANDPGSIPGDILRKLEELLDPKLPWNTILQKYMSAYSNQDYSWSRPNKRYWPNYYLPKSLSANLDKLFVAIDVSGSIDQKQFDEFIAEINYIKSDMNPSQLKLLFFDTRVVFEEDYEQYDEINVSLKAGGGTMIGPVIDKIVEYDPEVAIIFTDGEFSMPHMADVNSDVIWIINSAYTIDSFKPPRGEVIEYR